MEVLVATVIIAISLVPAMEALQTSLSGSEIHRNAVEEHIHLRGKLEEVLAEPVKRLEAAALAAGGPANPSSYSEPPGTVRRRLVYLSRYDGDNLDSDNNPFTGMDPGLLWVKVHLEGSNQDLESLVTWVD